MLLSRAGDLKQALPDTPDVPAPEELVQWYVSDALRTSNYYSLSMKANHV